MNTAIARLIELDREVHIIAHIGALLGWDQETFMPQGAIEERAAQLALVEGLAHEKATSPQIGSLLASFDAELEVPASSSTLTLEERAYLRALRRAYDRRVKLPLDLVTETARATSLSQAAWVEARTNNDFSAFAPHLQTMIELNKRKAAHIDPEARPYDVLLDEFEPDSTEASIGSVFSALRPRLVDLLNRIKSVPQVDDSFLKTRVPDEAQKRASEWLMNILGYDRNRGRLDTTAHPFTTTLGADDVRITTRFLPEYFPSAVFSTIHETGHALYELGIDPAPGYSNTVLAEAVSMAVHESQSRMWENMIGRSAEFWKEHYPTLKALLAPALDNVRREDFVRAINKVEPSFIRTEADEVTYGLHVILRFELESALISGSLAVKDLPAAWNEKMKELLGVVPPDDAHGCLQDIHWSMGAFGYFPSYSLGNLYAAQFWNAMKRDVPGLVALGRQDAGASQEYDTSPVLAWLREHIHKPGSTWTPGELVQRVTGEPLNADHFVRYLEAKYEGVYRLT